MKIKISLLAIAFLFAPAFVFASVLNIVSNETTTVDGNPSVVLSSIHYAWTADLDGLHDPLKNDGTSDGSKWIWVNDDLPTSSCDQTYLFEKTFTLPNPIASSTLYFAVDNRATVRLKGDIIADSQTGLAYAKETEGIYPLLPSNFLIGENKLSITATNDGCYIDQSSNPGGILYKLVMEESAPAITLSNPTETEDDNLQDTKGVADKTNFTFSVMASGNPDSVKFFVDGSEKSLVKIGDGYTAISVFPKGTHTWYFEATKGSYATTTTEKTFTTGYSNVAFLPGIEASRLYSAEILNGQLHGDEDQLWEPNGYKDVEDLFLTPEGKSVNRDIYTKTSIGEGIIGEVNITPILQGNIYKSFFSDLEKWKNTDHVFADYAVLPYDWRLSIDDVLRNGSVVDGRLYYSDTSDESNPQYILGQIKQLAKSSDTGKVTIIAHSNGGLIAKALLKRLGDVNDPLLAKVDNTVLVAVPQVGTPQAIGGLLHGYELSLPFTWFPLLLDAQTSRAFASTSPMAYHLLPSASYFSSAGILITTPVVSFDNGSLTQPFIATYGKTITDSTALHNFFLGSEGRTQPTKANTTSPSKVSPTLLSYAENIHQEIDGWVPPTSMNVYQIAGWGEDTLAGVRYWTGSECSSRVLGFCVATSPKLLYTPEDVIDGDGTVVTPSAFAMSVNLPNVSRWWVDLLRYDTIFTLQRGHKDIFEVPQLRSFIKDNILTQSTTDLPIYLSKTVPPTDLVKRLRYFLHSPLTLSAHDQNGNEINAANSTIPDARYKQYGEVQSISLPASSAPTITLNGYETGSFSLEVQEVTGNIVTATATFTGVPSSPNIIATMSFPNGTITGASALVVDENGDGKTVFSLTPKLGAIVTPDMISPEAKISVDPTTKDLKIEGVDESPTTVTKSGSNYVITDASGNITTLFFQKTYLGKLLTYAKLTGIQYGTKAKISLPSSSFLYLWNPLVNPPVLLSQTIAVNGTYAIEAVYDKKKNQTTVLLKKKGVQIQKQIFTGLKVVKLTVDKGTIGYEI